MPLYFDFLAGQFFAFHFQAENQTVRDTYTCATRLSVGIYVVGTPMGKYILHVPLYYYYLLSFRPIKNIGHPHPLPIAEELISEQ